MTESTNQTAAVGTKWNQDGTIRPFPGNTILLWIPPDSTLHATAATVANAARDLPIADYFGFLPPDSYHMTVLGLLNDTDRNRHDWSEKVPLSAPMAEADTVMHESIRDVKWPGDISMSVEQLSAVGNLTIYLVPTDVESKRRLHYYRAAISAATGVRRHDHDQYRFHISLAYRLTELPSQEHRSYSRFIESATNRLLNASPVTLTAPEFCVFDDMLRYLPWERRHQLVTRTHEPDRQS